MTRTATRRRFWHEFVVLCLLGASQVLGQQWLGLWWWEVTVVTAPAYFAGVFSEAHPKSVSVKGTKQ